ncbi:hypothetical protein KSS87_005801, partial [Heliosperma pusillum]
LRSLLDRFRNLVDRFLRSVLGRFGNLFNFLRSLLLDRFDNLVDFLLGRGCDYSRGCGSFLNDSSRSRRRSREFALSASISDKFLEFVDSLSLRLRKFSNDISLFFKRH